MINLKMTKKEAKKQHEVHYVDDNKYPWGSRLSFGRIQIDKIKALKTVNAGDKVMIQAIGKVTEVRVADNEKGRASHNVEIQLQRIHIGNQDEEDMAFNEDGGDEY